jgi:hypothetical protein
MANFYKTLFGMKKITAGMTDENGNYDKERGHLSDGVIGLALLQRQPGFPAGLDHFGLEVEDVQTVRDRLKQFYPDISVSEPVTSFAGLRTHDPDNNHSIFPKRVWPTYARAISKKAGTNRAGLITSLFAARVAFTSLSIQKSFRASSGGRHVRRQQLLRHDGKVTIALRPGTWSSTADLMAGLDHFGLKSKISKPPRKITRILPSTAPGSAAERSLSAATGETRQKISRRASSVVIPSRSGRSSARSDRLKTPAKG